MNELFHRIPSPIKRVLSLLPAYPGTILFARALNLALRSHLPDDLKSSIEGRALRIEVKDAGLVLDFVYRANAFHALRPSGQPDLVISAIARDFFALMRRKEDADTLFFSRRLVMEGDTELGVCIKSSLDSIELPWFEFERVLGRIRGKVAGST